MRSRLTSAGHILGVGLVCFGVWFLLDARQLHASAETAPLGVRRSVSLAISGPVARVEEALGLDRVVNVADRVIGKTGTPGGSVLGGVPLALPPEAPPTNTTRSRHPSGSAPGAGHDGPGATASNPPGARKPVARPGSATPPPAMPPLRTPSATHPLTLLDVGDSIGEDLGIGLASALGATPDVTVVQRSVGNTGLSNLGYYDWLAQLPKEIAQYHPQVVAVMLGGNDAQSFVSGSTVVSYGTPTWLSDYRARVGELMSEATRGGARVMWVGLPIMGPTAGLSNTDMKLENSIYQSEARLHPGVVYVSSWKLFENPAGAYATYLTSPSGNLVQVRDPDEVHIDPPGGTDLLARYVVAAMTKAWHVRL